MVFLNYYMIPILILIFEAVVVNLTAPFMYKSKRSYSISYASGHQLGKFSKEYWQPSANRTVISYFANVLQIASCHWANFGNLGAHIVCSHVFKYCKWHRKYPLPPIMRLWSVDSPPTPPRGVVSLLSKVDTSTVL